MKQVTCKEHKKPCTLISNKTLNLYCTKCITKMQNPGPDLMDLDDYITSFKDDIKASHNEINETTESCQKKIMYDKLLSEIDRLQKSKIDDPKNEEKKEQVHVISDQSGMILKQIKSNLENGNIGKLESLKQASKSLSLRVQKQSQCIDREETSSLKRYLIGKMDAQRILFYLIDGFELLLFKQDQFRESLREIKPKKFDDSYEFKFINQLNLGEVFAYKIDNNGKKITNIKGGYYSLCRVDKPIQLQKKTIVEFQLENMFASDKNQNYGFEGQQNFGFATQSFFQTNYHLISQGPAIGCLLMNGIYKNGVPTNSGYFEYNEKVRFQIYQRKDFSADIQIYIKDALAFHTLNQKFDGPLIAMASLMNKWSSVQIS